MNDITLNASQRGQLNGLDSIVNVRDESGRLIGHLVPDTLFRDLFEAWADSQVTREEIVSARMAYKSEGGMTTAEAIAYIRRFAGETSK